MSASHVQELDEVHARQYRVYSLPFNQLQRRTDLSRLDIAVRIEDTFSGARVKKVLMSPDNRALWFLAFNPQYALTYDAPLVARAHHVPVYPMALNVETGQVIQ